MSLVMIAITVSLFYITKDMDYRDPIRKQNSLTSGFDNKKNETN